MRFAGILALSVGLSMDATAVAATRGLAAKQVHPRDVFSVAVLFGGSQALMPLFGWLIGVRFGPRFAAWDHWIIFVLLGGLGAKMLWEARGAADEEKPEPGNPFGLKLLLVLAFATSIDAFAAGLTLPLLEAPIVLSLLTIGVTTALLSAGGIYAGRHFGRMLGKRLDVFGGLVLIALGTKTLVEHLRAG